MLHLINFGTNFSFDETPPDSQTFSAIQTAKNLTISMTINDYSILLYSEESKYTHKPFRLTKRPPTK